MYALTLPILFYRHRWARVRGQSRGTKAIIIIWPEGGRRGEGSAGLGEGESLRKQIGQGGGKGGQILEEGFFPHENERDGERRRKVERGVSVGCDGRSEAEEGVKNRLKCRLHGMVWPILIYPVLSEIMVETWHATG